MSGVKFECRGYMVSPAKHRVKGGWFPFTLVWGGKENRATGRTK